MLRIRDMLVVVAFAATIAVAIWLTLTSVSPTRSAAPQACVDVWVGEQDPGVCLPLL